MHKIQHLVLIRFITRQGSLKNRIISWLCRSSLHWTKLAALVSESDYFGHCPWNRRSSCIYPRQPHAARERSIVLTKSSSELRDLRRYLVLHLYLASRSRPLLSITIARHQQVGSRAITGSARRCNSREVCHFCRDLRSYVFGHTNQAT